MLAQQRIKMVNLQVTSIPQVAKSVFLLGPLSKKKGDRRHWREKEDSNEYPTIPSQANENKRKVKKIVMDLLDHPTWYLRNFWLT